MITNNTFLFFYTVHGGLESSRVSTCPMLYPPINQDSSKISSYQPGFIQVDLFCSSYCRLKIVRLRFWSSPVIPRPLRVYSGYCREMCFFFPVLCLISSVPVIIMSSVAMPTPLLASSVFLPFSPLQ